MNTTLDYAVSGASALFVLTLLSSMAVYARTKLMYRDSHMDAIYHYRHQSTGRFFYVIGWLMWAAVGVFALLVALGMVVDGVTTLLA